MYILILIFSHPLFLSEWKDEKQKIGLSFASSLFLIPIPSHPILSYPNLPCLIFPCHILPSIPKLSLCLSLCVSFSLTLSRCLSLSLYLSHSLSLYITLSLLSYPILFSLRVIFITTLFISLHSSPLLFSSLLISSLTYLPAGAEISAVEMGKLRASCTPLVQWLDSADDDDDESEEED